MVGTASADVVGWWRFNGEGANVPNVAATADGLPDGTPRMTDGTIVSITSYGGNPSYGSDESQMPVVTNLFQQVAPRIVDQKTGIVYAGGQSLHWEGNKKQGGVIIPFNEAFVLSNATIEVIMRIPPEAASRSDRMFPLVQFGKDCYEGWLVLRGLPRRQRRQRRRTVCTRKLREHQRRRQAEQWFDCQREQLCEGLAVAL